jgi:hypothetical protein
MGFLKKMAVNKIRNIRRKMGKAEPFGQINACGEFSFVPGEDNY